MKQEKNFEDTCWLQQNFFLEKLGKNHRFQEHDETGKELWRNILWQNFWKNLEKNHRFQEQDEIGTELKKYIAAEFREKLRKTTGSKNMMK